MTFIIIIIINCFSVLYQCIYQIIRYNSHCTCKKVAAKCQLIAIFAGNCALHKILPISYIAI